jgi:TRAP-type mannitol/chloroaromatic compound transport system permease large subunit
VPTSKIVPGLVPFIVIHTLTIITITFIPELSLFLWKHCSRSSTRSFRWRGRPAAMTP